MGRFEDRTAIITGARLIDGEVAIGGAAARMLAAEGANVVVADVRADQAQALADEITAGGGRATAFGVDLADEAQIEALVAHATATYGGVDVLLNNAGHYRATDLDIARAQVEDWDAIFAVDVRGPLLTMKHVIPGMLERGGGSIVNTSSIASLSGDLIRTAYGCAKAALNTLTVCAATQYGPRGIRCNAVLPGITMTPLARTQRPEVMQTYRRHSLNPRANTPEDLARVLVFLAGDEAAGINGELIRVDDGMVGHLPFVADFRDSDVPVVPVNNH